MKKFNFSLQSLKDYKEHLFEHEKNVLNQMQAKLEQQMLLYAQKENEIISCQQKTSRRMFEGVTVGELNTLQAYAKNLEKQREEIKTLIEETKARIAQQTKAVLALRTEQAALDKLRDKQLDFYNKGVEKEQEKQIDEFVATSKSQHEAG